MQLRHDAQLDAVRQTTAQKTRGTIQPLLRLVLLAIQAREKNLGMRIVTRHFNARDGNQLHTRVVDFEANQLGNFTLNLLTDTLCSRKVSHYNVRATSTIS